MNNKLLEDARAAGFFIDAEGKIYSSSTLNYVNTELAKFAELQQQKWQPIETAPKDGKRFLAATTIPNHRQVIAIKSSQGIILDENLQPLYWPITHWMPLPSPPTDKDI